MKIFDEEFSRHASEKSGLSPYCIPMLPIVLSLLIAFGISRNITQVWAEVSACLGVAFLGASFWLRFSFEKWRFFSFSSVNGAYGDSKKITIFLRISQTLLPSLAVFFIGIFYARGYFENRETCAPTEAEITFEVLDVSRGTNGSQNGIGRILSSNVELFGNVESERVWFSIYPKGRKSEDLLPTQTVIANGYLAPVDFTFEYPLPKNPDLKKERIRQRRANDMFVKYLSSVGVSYKFSAQVENIRIIKSENLAWSFFAKVRKYMEYSLSSFPVNGFSESESARTYRAMILGDKSLLSKYQKDDFIETGTMHVFAISGMHVGFAAAALYLIPLGFGFRRWRAAVFVLPILFVYVCACGARASAMRAFMMIAFIWCATLIWRKIDTFSAVLLSAFIALLFNPTILGNSGFSLSYGVVLALIIYGAPRGMALCNSHIPYKYIPEIALTFREKSCRYLTGYILLSLSMGFAAAVAAAPLTAYFFGYVAPYSILFSPFFTFGAGIVVVCGFMGFMLPSFLAEWLNLAGSLIVSAMSYMAKFGADVLPKLDFNIANGWLAAMALSIFLVFALLMPNRIWSAPIFGIISTVLFGILS